MCNFKKTNILHAYVEGKGQKEIQNLMEKEEPK